MPVVINTAINLAFGAGFVWQIRDSADLRESPTSWPFLAFALFQALIFTPVATFLFRFYPQWSLLYWFDPQIFTTLDDWIGALSALVLLIGLAAAFAGFFAARYGVVSEQPWLLWLPIGVSGATVLVTMILFAKRLVLVGDYDEYWHGTAGFWLLRPAGWAGALLYGSMYLFLRLGGRRFRRTSGR
jgi:hypothetical protein